MGQVWLHLICASPRPRTPGASVLGRGSPAGGSVTPPRHVCAARTHLLPAGRLAGPRRHDHRGRREELEQEEQDQVEVYLRTRPRVRNAAFRAFIRGRSGPCGRAPRTGPRRQATTGGAPRTGHHEQVTTNGPHGRALQTGPRGPAWTPATALGDVLGPQQARPARPSGIQLDLTWASLRSPAPSPTSPGSAPHPPPAFTPTPRVTAKTRARGVCSVHAPLPGSRVSLRPCECSPS